jgi:hypothetical protein
MRCGRGSFHNPRRKATIRDRRESFVSKISAWFISAALAHALAAQQITIKPPNVFGRVWDIPALSYGPNEWSVVRLTNQSEASRSVQVDVYSQRGERLPIGPDFMLNPHQVLDIRIDRAASKQEMCWARVVDDENAVGQLRVTPLVEILSGNELFDYEREVREFSSRSLWAFRASDLQFKTVYFLNGFDQPTVVTFCESNSRERDPCRRKDGSPARFTVGPHQSIAVDVRRLRQKYFFILSSVPRAAMLVVLRDGEGRRKQFSSDSTIRFGERE